jgi:hypothetical protein
VLRATAWQANATPIALPALAWQARVPRVAALLAGQRVEPHAEPHGVRAAPPVRRGAAPTRWRS